MTKNRSTKSVNSRRLIFWLLGSVYKLLGKNTDRIPYPFLEGFIDNYGGGWAGVGFYVTKRKYQYEKKKEKTKKVLAIIIAITVIVGLVILAFVTPGSSFLYGFLQNLLADICLGLLALYLVPGFLKKKPKEYHLDLIQINDPLKIGLYLYNNGEEAFKINEAKLSIYFPEKFNYSSITYKHSECIKKSDESFIPFSDVIDWENNATIFVGEKIKILEISKKTENSCGFLFYKFFTLHGNFPTVEFMSQEALNFCQNCIVGELKIEETDS